MSACELHARKSASREQALGINYLWEDQLFTLQLVWIDAASRAPWKPFDAEIKMQVHKVEFSLLSHLESHHHTIRHPQPPPIATPLIHPSSLHSCNPSTINSMALAPHRNFACILCTWWVIWLMPILKPHGQAFLGVLGSAAHRESVK
jgi:hypothetical protein